MRCLKWIIPVGCGLLTLILFHTVFLLAYVPTASMEPTIPNGSIVLGIRSDVRLENLERGDLVFFQRDAQLLVKRIAAVAGDTVQVNGAEKVVPDDCIYVLGDNGNASIDSRQWQEPFVRAEQVVARYLGE